MIFINYYVISSNNWSFYDTLKLKVNTNINDCKANYKNNSYIDKLK